MTSRVVSPIEFVPGSYFEPIRLGDLFARTAPIEIDLGSGDGAFLIAMAQRHPDRNFLGVERLLGRVRGTCELAVQRDLGNLRVLRIESGYALRYLIPPGSAAVIHLMFPDPWPKRRHWSRRLFNAEFLRLVHTALEPGGELRLKTDHDGYFAQMQKVFRADPGFRQLEWPDDPDYPISDFERKFLRRGLPIYRARLGRNGSTE